jgi:F-box and leucine-rich repeat protein 2/20
MPTCSSSFNRCTAVTDDGLAAISNGCKRMKKLNLCYCNQISDTGLAHLRLLEELSDLELRGMVRITSSGITAMAMGCRRLTQLDLKRCYSVDDTGMWALARYTENLRQVILENEIIGFCWGRYYCLLLILQ